MLKPPKSGRSNHSPLNNLAAVDDVDAWLCGLSAQSATVQGEPPIVVIACHTHTFRCENFANSVNFDNFFNSRLPLSEVQDKGADVGFVA